MWASTEDVEFDSFLAAFREITHHLAAIGYGLARPTCAGHDFLGIFGGVGKEIGIHLGKEANINKELKLLVKHITRPFNSDIGRAEAASVMLKLRQNDLFFHKAAFWMKYQIAPFKVLTPEQAFEKEADVLMMLDQFAVMKHQPFSKGGAAVHTVFSFSCFSYLDDCSTQGFDLGDTLLQLIEKVPKVHVGHNNVVLNILHQGIDELEMLNILQGHHPVVQAKANPVRVLGKKEAIVLRQLCKWRDAVHAKHSILAVQPPRNRTLRRMMFFLIGRAAWLHLGFATDWHYIAVAAPVWLVAQHNVVWRRFLLLMHTLIAIADQVQLLILLIVQIQRTGDVKHLQGHGYADSIEVVQRIILLGQIEKRLEKVIKVTGKVILFVANRFLSHSLAHFLQIRTVVHLAVPVVKG